MKSLLTCRSQQDQRWMFLRTGSITCTLICGQNWWQLSHILFNFFCTPPPLHTCLLSQNNSWQPSYILFDFSCHPHPNIPHCYICVKTAQHDRHQPKHTGAFNYTFFLHFHFPTAKSIQTLFDKQQNVCFCEFVKNLLYATSQTELCCLIKTRGCLVADSKEFDLASLYEK